MMVKLSGPLGAITTFILTLILSGCATGSTAPSRAISVQPHRIYWNNATTDFFTVKVTRDSGQMGSLCMTRLSMDDNLVADINQGESVTFKVTAGVHSLGAIQISGGSKSGKTFCDDIPQEVKVTVSGVSGDTVAYRYSYAGSGIPALTVTSF